MQWQELCYAVEEASRIPSTRPRLDDAQKLKGLEKENAELKKMLAESLLENRALKIVNAKKF